MGARARLAAPRQTPPVTVSPPPAVRAALVALCAAALLLGACAPAEEERPEVVVGVGSTTEQRVLAALTVVALRAEGLPVSVRTDLGGTVALRREALRGAVDVYWDYTGAAWALGLQQQAPPADPDESFARVRSADESRGLAWLPPSRANATLALFVRAADLPAESRSMTWLAGELSGGDKTLCADADFISRPGGLEALADAYAIERGRLRLKSAAEAEALQGVAAGECFAGLATATSGEAHVRDLVPVADDQMIFPAFVVAPVARAAALGEHPAIVPALARVVAALDTAALAALNGAVERGRDPQELATEHLATPAP